jgi:hypothetical protein
VYGGEQNYVALKRVDQHAALYESMCGPRTPEQFQSYNLLVNNGVLVNYIPHVLIYVNTNASLRRVIKKYVALLWIEVGQPWLRITSVVQLPATEQPNVVS